MRFFLHFGASDFPSKNPFKKRFKIFFFSLWRRDPVLKLQFPTPLCVVLLCFATHIVMAVSRLLHAVAAYVILLFFAAGLRKSYWSGYMNFLHLGASDFPSKNAFKKCFKIFFFSLWRRDPVLKLQFPTPLRVVLCFATHIVMAASRLLHAVAACVILLSFAAGLRKSYWSGCMKAATVICQQIFSILALVIFLLKILLKSASKSSFFRSGVEIRFWSYNFRRHCA